MVNGEADGGGRSMSRRTVVAGCWNGKKHARGSTVTMRMNDDGMRGRSASNAFICLFTKQIRKRITTAKTYAGFLHIRRDDYCRKMARPVMEKIVIQFQFPLKSQLKLVV